MLLAWVGYISSQELVNFVDSYASVLYPSPGAGYVGAPTMAVMAKYCPNVRFMVCDISQRQIDAWNSDSLPIYEPGLEDVIKVVRDRNLWFTTDIPKAIETCDMIFVAVNTPTKTTGAVSTSLQSQVLCLSHSFRACSSCSYIGCR